jgi:hypothetical protein
MMRRGTLDARAIAHLVGWASVGTGALLFVAPAFSAQLFGMGDHVQLMRYLGARDLFIGGAILLGRQLPLWMIARAVADSADVAITLGVLISGSPHPGRAVGGLFFAGAFCCLDIFLALRLQAQRLQERDTAGQPLPKTIQGRQARPTGEEAR